MVLLHVNNETVGSQALDGLGQMAKALLSQLCPQEDAVQVWEGCDALDVHVSKEDNEDLREGLGL